MLLALAACSGRGEDEGARPAPSTGPAGSTALGRWSAPSDDPFVEEMTTELMDASQQTVPAPFPLAEPQARCLSSTLLRRVGLETLARVGEDLGPGGLFDLGALTTDERRRFAGALMSCLDVPQLLASQLQGMEGLDADELECVIGELTRDGTITGLVRQAIVDGTDISAQQAALAGPMAEAFDACLPADEVARLREAEDGGG